MINQVKIKEERTFELITQIPSISIIFKLTNYF